MRFATIVKRYSSICLPGLVVFSCYAKEATITVFRHYQTNQILWGGDGTAAWNVLQLERRGIWLYSYVLQTSGSLSGFDIEIADDDSLQNVYDRLNTNPVEDFKYVNWAGDWSGHITPYFKTGDVLFGGEDGRTPIGVVINNGGDMSNVSLTHQGNGYVSDPFVLDGVTGQYQVFWSTPHESYISQFVPNWGGGISNGDSPTTTVVPFDPTAYNAGIVDSSGGSGGGGDSTSVFNYNYVNTTTITREDGTTINVVDVPKQTVNIPTSGGGTVSFTQFDYSGILNSIGGVLESHAHANNDALTTINENLQKQLEIQDDGNLQVAPTNDTEYDVDDSELSEINSTISGWGFDFGMGTNPIGSLFTSILGNPPTSFGSVDRVWDVDFEICNGVRVKSTFSLSDYFPRAFRSTVLMLASIAFAIASAKAVSGAFS